MKNTLISSLIALSFLTACTPEDRKITLKKDANTSTTSGASANSSLKFGSYGHSIWAVQSVEQMGQLVASCLKSSEPVETTTDGQVKNCEMNYTNIGDNFRIMENWKIRLLLKTMGTELVITQALGDFVNGDSSSNVGSTRTLAFLIYQIKKFEMKQVADTEYALKIQSSGEIGGGGQYSHFSQYLLSNMKQENQAWILTKFSDDLAMLQAGRRFIVTADEVKINWVTETCGEAEGEFLNAEVNGKYKDKIRLTPSLAEPVDKKYISWTQPLVRCGTDRGTRDQSRLNFEYFFF